MSLGILLTVATLELGLRLAPGIPPAVSSSVGLHGMRTIVQRDELAGYVLRPDVTRRALPTYDFSVFHVSTSPSADGRIGVRGELAPGEDVFGVIVGDSFAMGWGVEQEDSFVAYLERQTGKRFVTFGVAGYGPQQAGILLREHALDLDPEVVLWLFYGNDLNDAVGFDAARPGEERKESFAEKSAFSLWFDSHCSTYKCYRWLAPYMSSRRVHWAGEHAEYLFTFEWQDQVDPELEQTQRGLELIGSELETLASLSHSEGFTPLVLTLGYKEQVYGSELRELAGERVRLTSAQSSRAMADLAERARGLGMVAVDLTPALRDVREEQIFFVNDVHLTAAGNRVIGEQIVEALVERGLVSARPAAGH